MKRIDRPDSREIFVQYSISNPLGKVIVWVCEAERWEDLVVGRSYAGHSILIAAPEAPHVLKTMFSSRWRTVYELHEQVADRILTCGGIEVTNQKRSGPNTGAKEEKRCQEP